LGVKGRGEGRGARGARGERGERRGTGGRALMGRFFGTGYGGVSTVEKRASRFLAVWGYVPIHAPGARHDSLGRIIARARDRVTADAAPLATVGIRPRPAEFCDGAGATLRHHRWGGGDCAAGRTRGSDGAPALARVALRGRAHSRDQTRGHASGARCDHMFRAAPALGAGLAVPGGIAGGPRYGCAYVGPTLHRAGDPPDLSGLCAPDGLGRAASTPERGVAVSWERRCTLIRPGAPTGWTVIVMADRGWYAQWLDRPIQAPGWRPLLRIKAGGTYRAEGAAAFRPPVQTVQQGKAGWGGRAPCLSGPTSRLAGPLRARGDDDHTAPGLILTDRVPAPADVVWDGLRPIIAGGFKDVNRGGRHGEPTKMTDPARAVRLWLGSAVAALWVVRVGGCAEADGPARMIAALPAAPVHPSQRTRPRLLRCFRRGVIVIVTPVITPGTLRAARCIPEPWPKTLDPWAALPSAQQPHQEAAE
jgi:hypothetical protein